MNSENKEKEILTGVNCRVEGCIYHFGIGGCTAPFVNITNKNSFFSTGTKCGSYKEKK